MRLSFDDEESLKEALHFNPPSDPDSLERVESSSSMPLQERNEPRPELEDICYDNPQSDPNIILECRWEVVVIIVVRHPRRGVKILKDIYNILTQTSESIF